MNAKKIHNGAPALKQKYMPDLIIDRLLPKLMEGNRDDVRCIIARALASGVSSETLAESVAWPIHETLHKLSRHDQIEQVAFNYATRALRNAVDHLQLGYRKEERNGKSVMLFCGSNENEDLGGQLASDLLEAAGFTVTFGGGGVAHDEILSEVHQRRPDFLVLFASAASDAPGIRNIIDAVRTVNGLPELEVVVGGGVFNRADGLAEEIGANRVAKSPVDLVNTLKAERNEIEKLCQTQSQGELANTIKQKVTRAVA